MQNNKRGLKAATHAMILGLALSTAAVGAPATLAEAPASIIDNTTNATLTIHKKYLDDISTQGETGNAGGAVPDSVNGDPLEGVKYTVRKLKGDVTTQAGLKELVGKAQSVKEGATLAEDDFDGSEVTETTGADGTAHFDFGTERAAYLVTESVPKSGVIRHGKSDDKVGGVVGAPPFVVFVPMTNADGTGWNYQVNAYPKNSSESTGEKAADNSTVPNAGDTLPYLMSLNIPKPGAGGKITKYVITDPLPDQVIFQGVELRIANGVSVTGDSKVTAETFGAQGEALDPEDFTVNPSSPSDTAGGTVTITLTPSGLAELAEAKKSNEKAKVLVKLNTKVAEFDATKLGDAKNNVNITFNNGDSANDVTTPDTETDNAPKFGKVVFTKKGKDGDAEALAGAQFELYNCTKQDQQAPVLGSKITLQEGGVQPRPMITAEQGTLTFPALQQKEGATEGYCLVETKAPEGYELLPGPVWFQVNTGNVTAEPIKLTATDEKKTSTEYLPGTGGMGVGILIALGAAVLGLGGFMARRQAKKSS